jgi:putative addiction module CopG family antidote
MHHRSRRPKPVIRMGMNVNLTPELETLVRRKVASGMYTSASEVVREALRLMEEQAHDERPEGCAARCGAGKENGHRRGAHFWPVLAPRPGLEPGTYGLTEQHTVQSDARKLMIPNGFLKRQRRVVMRPNLFRTSMVGSGGVRAESRSESTACGDSDRPDTERGRRRPELRSGCLRVPRLECRFFGQ